MNICTVTHSYYKIYALNTFLSWPRNYSVWLNQFGTHQKGYANYHHTFFEGRFGFDGVLDALILFIRDVIQAN